MKKQVKIVISLVLLTAILIIGVSLFYPEVFKGITSGTFGKADKYHKSQMTEADVKLRSELTSDTAKLKSMIQGLIYFSLFTQDLSHKIDSCVTTFQNHGICSQEGGCSKVVILQDYSDFIKNNNKTLGTTISMLTGMYLKDQSDESADVEKNLRDFGNYVYNLNEKDSILEQALRSMDNYMLTNKTLKARKKELANLKSIRDQLLLGSIQLSGLLQDKPLSAALCSYALSSQQSLNVLYGQAQLGNAALMGQQQIGNIAFMGQQQIANQFMNQSNLERAVVGNQLQFNSAEQLQDIIQAQQLGALNSKADDLGSNLVGNVILYDKDSYQFVVSNISTLGSALSAAQMNALVLGSQSLGIVVFFSDQGLQMMASGYDLSNAVQSQVLGSTLSSAQLNSLLNSQEGIGSFSYGSQFISGIGYLLNNQSLGVGIIQQ